MAGKRAVKDHVQLHLVGIFVTIVVFVILKSLLRKTGHDQIAQDF